MDFSIGYQVRGGEPGTFAEVVQDYREHVREVYFAWPGEPSGRAPLDPAAAPLMREELSWIGSLGIGLNLLLNASCYGERALSRSLEQHVVSLVGEVAEAVGVSAVTTMSPVVARAVKAHFPAVDVRASVNMRLGTVQALEYAAPYFDSFTVQREVNRDLKRLAELQAWAGANGKRLHVLANSGCLNYCAFQTFHDNAVAHGGEIGKHENLPGIEAVCRSYYTQPEHRVSFLRGSWIRPEDVAKHAARIHCGYKLATRLHDNPRLVLHAYATGRHYGNLLDLMEPGYSPQFAPTIIDNRAFPADWFERTSTCSHRCHECAYCTEVLDRVLRCAPGERRESAQALPLVDHGEGALPGHDAV